MSALTLVTKGMIGCLNIPQRKRYESGDGGEYPRQPKVYYQDMNIIKKQKSVTEMFVEMKLLEEEEDENISIRQTI